MESWAVAEECRATVSPSVPLRSRVGIRAASARSVSAMTTLAARIADHETAAFVGRHRELLAVDALLATGGVLLVHGPGGIGKSVLLREIARRGARAGYTPFALDARDLPPVPDAVEDALAGAWSAERPLVVIDTYERMSALGGYLRSTLLPSLPASAAIVVAGRDAPEPGWFEGGWETVVSELALRPLAPRAATSCSIATGWARTRARRRSRAGSRDAARTAARRHGGARGSGVGAGRRRRSAARPPAPRGGRGTGRRVR